MILKDELSEVLKNLIDFLYFNEHLELKLEVLEEQDQYNITIITPYLEDNYRSFLLAIFKGNTYNNKWLNKGGQYLENIKDKIIDIKLETTDEQTTIMLKTI